MRQSGLGFRTEVATASLTARERGILVSEKGARTSTPILGDGASRACAVIGRMAERHLVAPIRDATTATLTANAPSTVSNSGQRHAGHELSQHQNQPLNARSIRIGAIHSKNLSCPQSNFHTMYLFSNILLKAKKSHKRKIRTTHTVRSHCSVDQRWSESSRNNYN